MTQAKSDPRYIVQIKHGGRWTTALRLGTQANSGKQDEPKARRTYEKLVESGHYEGVRVLVANGQKEGKTSYRRLEETDGLDVTNPLPPKLKPKGRFRVEWRLGEKPWRGAKELPNRDDAFALALRYHRQDPRRSVRVLEPSGPNRYQEIMHRQPSLGGGHHHHGPANQNHDDDHHTGFFGWVMGGGPSGRRRNGLIIIACFVGLMVVNNNQIGASRLLEKPEREETLTGLIAVADLDADTLQEACAKPPEVSVKFFESIRVAAEDQQLLTDYLKVVSTIGSAWSFRHAGGDCYVTFTGGAAAPGSTAPTQIDCRIKDFFFTQFGNPAAANADPTGCMVL